MKSLTYNYNSISITDSDIGRTLLIGIAIFYI